MNLTKTFNKYHLCLSLHTKELNIILRSITRGASTNDITKYPKTKNLTNYIRDELKLNDQLLNIYRELLLSKCRLLCTKNNDARNKYLAFLWSNNNVKHVKFAYINI